MSRTTKKTASANKNSTTAIAMRSNETLNKQTSHARNEKSAQITLERMQAAIHKGQFDKSVLLQKAENELIRIAKIDNYLKNNNLKKVSNYETLLKLWNRDLAHLTKDHFIEESRNAIKRFKTKFRSEITQEQAKVIVEYYDGKANESFQIVDNVRLLLVQKGMINEQPKEEQREPVTTEQPAQN